MALRFCLNTLGFWPGTPKFGPRNAFKGRTFNSAGPSGGSGKLSATKNLDLVKKQHFDWLRRRFIEKGKVVDAMMSMAREDWTPEEFAAAILTLPDRQQRRSFRAINMINNERAKEVARILGKDLKEMLVTPAPSDWKSLDPEQKAVLEEIGDNLRTKRQWGQAYNLLSEGMWSPAELSGILSRIENHKAIKYILELFAINNYLELTVETAAFLGINPEEFLPEHLKTAYSSTKPDLARSQSSVPVSPAQDSAKELASQGQYKKAAELIRDEKIAPAYIVDIVMPFSLEQKISFMIELYNCIEREWFSFTLALLKQQMHPQRSWDELASRLQSKEIDVEEEIKIGSLTTEERLERAIATEDIIDVHVTYRIDLGDGSYRRAALYLGIELESQTYRPGESWLASLRGGETVKAKVIRKIPERKRFEVEFLRPEKPAIPQALKTIKWAKKREAKGDTEIDIFSLLFTLYFYKEHDFLDRFDPAGTEVISDFLLAHFLNDRAEVSRILKLHVSINEIIDKLSNTLEKSDGVREAASSLAGRLQDGEIEYEIFPLILLRLERDVRRQLLALLEEDSRTSERILKMIDEYGFEFLLGKTRNKEGKLLKWAIQYFESQLRFSSDEALKRIIENMIKYGVEPKHLDKTKFSGDCLQIIISLHNSMIEEGAKPQAAPSAEPKLLTDEELKELRYDIEDGWYDRPARILYSKGLRPEQMAEILKEFPLSAQGGIIIWIKSRNPEMAEKILQKLGTTWNEADSALQEKLLTDTKYKVWKIILMKSLDNWARLVVEQLLASGLLKAKGIAEIIKDYPQDQIDAVLEQIRKRDQTLEIKVRKKLEKQEAEKPETRRSIMDQPIVRQLSPSAEISILPVDQQDIILELQRIGDDSKAARLFYDRIGRTGPMMAVPILAMFETEDKKGILKALNKIDADFAERIANYLGIKI